MRVMTRLALIWLGAGAGLPGASVAPARYNHVLTLGSRLGIYPRKPLNGKPAQVVFGAPERPYALSIPDAVAVDGERRIWVTDRGTNSVHVFDILHGRYKELSGAAGSAFRRPSAIASDGQGRIYIGDAADGRVFVFEPDGEFGRLLTGKPGDRRLGSPSAIAVSPDNRTVYVADPPRRKIVAFNQEGEVIQEWGQPGEVDRPAALTFRANRLYVLDKGLERIQIFTPSGRLTGSLGWNSVRAPSAFAYDPRNGRFLVGNPRWETVEVFDEAGRGIGAFGQSGGGNGEIHGPDFLHIDAEGFVYVVDSHHGRVLVFSDTIPSGGIP